MPNDALYGVPWSRLEVEAVVSAYIEMLGLEIAGRSYVKAKFNRALQETIGRTHRSIEQKFCNISAVLQRLGLPWIKGYKPLSNFQVLLLEVIEGRLDTGQLRLTSGLAEDGVGALAQVPLQMVSPPAQNEPHQTANDGLERLVRKFDPAVRDSLNRHLGRRGEELVFSYECERLAALRPDLARKVEWTSQERGDGAGYDIRSFNADGTERLIEVKTTLGYERTPFFISSNELDFSEQRPNEFRLVRVFDFAKAPRAFELAPPLGSHLLLTPQSFRASPI